VCRTFPTAFPDEEVEGEAGDADVDVKTNSTCNGTVLSTTHSDRKVRHRVTESLTTFRCHAYITAALVKRHTMCSIGQHKDTMVTDMSASTLHCNAALLHCMITCRNHLLTLESFWPLPMPECNTTITHVIQPFKHTCDCERHRRFVDSITLASQYSVRAAVHARPLKFEPTSLA
jgi:hypothetical protein